LASRPGHERQLSHWDDARLDALARIADPIADEVVAAHAREQSQSQPTALVSGISRHLVLPDEGGSSALSAYLADRPALPAWTDGELLARSARFFSDFGLEIGSGLFLASLPEAYACARGVRVLALTARMVTDPVRRVNETAQFVFDTMVAGGLDVDAPGYRDCRRVRLMHAAVRYLILNDDRIVKLNDDRLAPGEGPEQSWNLAHGVPLNQEDLLGTLLTFTCAVFRALDRQGIAYARADAEAYLHAWCVVGHLLGIRGDLLPIELDEAWELAESIQRRQKRPSADARLLGGALIAALQRSIRFRIFKGLPESVIRWYVGDDVGDIIGATRFDWTRVAFGPVRRGLRVLGAVERHDRLVRALVSSFSLEVLRRFVTQGRGSHRPAFSLPRELDERVRDAPTRWRF
jgi:hypothetical protein